MSNVAVRNSTEFAGVPLVGTAGVFYTNRDDIRFELALDTAEAYRDAGLPFVVVDASPGQREGDDWVAAALQARGADVLSAEIPGIATQRQQGVATAVRRGATKVVGQEPEKPTVPSFAAEISHGLDTSDILVIGRTAVAEASLPPVQCRTERLAGWILGQTLNMPNDALAGPRGFTIAGAEVLAAYPATDEGMNNWLYMYETVLAARRKNLPVGSLALDMIYPAGMVAEETNNPVFDGKRFDQFTMQLSHLLKGVQTTDLTRARASMIAKRTEDFLEVLTAAKSLEDRKRILGDMEQTFAYQFGYRAPDEPIDVQYEES